MYITREELEQALKEQGLYDADKIKEVISDADSDNVRNKYYEIQCFLVLIAYVFIFLSQETKFTFAHVGWKDRLLFRVCGDDEERDSWC